MDLPRSDRGPAEPESALVEDVVEHLRDRLAAADAPRCEQFARQFYRWVPPQDLAGRGAADLCGAALAQWRLMQQRESGAASIRVYNPHLEEDGWQSTHTVIQIVSDDMPFLVDSLTMEFNRRAIGIHLVIHPVMRVRRDDEGRLLEVLTRAASAPDERAESVLHAEVDRETDAERLRSLEVSIAVVFAEVRAAVDDWRPMRARLAEAAASIGDGAPARADLEESRAYLEWLDDNHFTFLGYQEYDVVRGRSGEALRAVKKTGLGLLRPKIGLEPADADPAWARTIAASPQRLVLAKASARSSVHRPSYLDYVGVKRLDARGRLVGERRFLGLYTTRAYWERAQEIPILRGKVAHVLERAGFAADSHDRKALLEILEDYPRDELVQVGLDELFTIAMGVLAIGERQLVRLFARRDEFERFVSCLVFLPRDRFNTENRRRVAAVLGDALSATLDEWTLLLSESVLVRLHYVFRTTRGAAVPTDTAAIEARLAHVTRTWADDLRDALVEELGEEPGLELYHRYADAFPAAYRADWDARVAVADIVRAEEIAGAGGLGMVPYRPPDVPEGMLRCKLFSSAVPILLSDVLPIFEHMGARIIDERPYELTFGDSSTLWLYDFGFATDRAAVIEVDELRARFQEAFVGVWRGTYENDALNRLVLDAHLSGREVTILRAIGRYLRQCVPTQSDAATRRALTAHPNCAALLAALFRARFDPSLPDRGEAERLDAQLERAIDAVASLDEDRILRSHLAVVRAMSRTDYFQRAPDGQPKPSLAFKLEPQRVAALPAPRPRFEIFVHSPRLEGVHMRGGRVARGGLRWSDRRNDFRTEILGLMKAQMVKNAVIVPVGAKGGFVVRQPPADGGPGALRDEVIACYRSFVTSLLDLTDNIHGGQVVGPADVVRHDDDDPYLVVAADKGTATYSDLANEISVAHGFWLGDAFASGGSTGYDHKRIGITARGAWEAVRRHFRELGTNVQTTDFTVVGIGDMSGDVFGNGLLLSPHLKLIGAFNHSHVFLDPTPDPEASHAERRRLFELERSAWSDYDAARISTGGGVFSRSAKWIALSPQARVALDVQEESLSPDEVIRALLRARVDLLWNGGIGTYVKARSETHADVGDKTNDGVRVDGAELRCRVVGEGGNLGFTQRGRVEYASAGGRINTDAIDNVGGVNCSDREVNIKILLDAVVAAGELTVKQRNRLLVQMTDEVAALVLGDSYAQTQGLSVAMSQQPVLLDLHARLMRSLEQAGTLDRSLDFLPSDEEIAERELHEIGLTSPELAVLLAHTKIALHASLLESTLPEDDYLADELHRYFPAALPERFAEELHRHRLRREIVATYLTNEFVDRAGMSVAFALGEETGAAPADLVRAYAVAREVFAMRDFWAAVERLDDVADPQAQTAMLLEGRALIERATRWLVRNCRHPLDIAAAIDRYADGAAGLAQALPAVLDDPDRESLEQSAARLAQSGVPAPLAARTAAMVVLPAAFDVVEIAAATGHDAETVTATHFGAAGRFSLHWLRDRIGELPRGNRWQVLARAALRDDLAALHRALSTEILRAAPGTHDATAAIEDWVEQHGARVERFLTILTDIKASRTYDLTTLAVALREARNLASSA